MFSWLTATPRGRGDTCPDPHPKGLTLPARCADYPELDPPPARPVSAREQVPAIIEALQEEGLTGVVFRDDILDRYKEHCWMLGFEPVSTNAICEALKKRGIKKLRPFVGRRRLVAYVIPARDAEAATTPIGNKPRVLAPKKPRSARTGTWPKPANDLRRHVSATVGRECERIAA